MNILKIEFFVFFIIGFISCSSEDSTSENSNTLDEPLAFYKELNVPYGSHPEQVYDIYLPANRTMATKVMILIHGGGWTSGDKSSLNYIKDFFLNDLQDVAVVNMNYRLADDNTSPFPMQLNDITAVLNHLENNENIYIISDDIGFVGVSAGAHLSMLWSYAFDANNNTNMVCSIVGPTNFTDPAYLSNPDSNIQDYINLFGLNATLAFLETVSPYHQATSTSAPTILFYGDQDSLVPTSQGTAMRDRLDALGVINQFTLYPNEGHGWDGEELLDTWTKLKVFIEVYL